MREHLRREVSDLLALDSEVCDAIRARADVYHCARQRLNIPVESRTERNQWGVRTSSRGANPVPYRRMPRTSPNACLNAVPRAMALSCEVLQHGKPGPKEMVRGDCTYLQCGGRLSRDRPGTSWSMTSRSVSQAHGTSVVSSVSASRS